MNKRPLQGKNDLLKAKIKETWGHLSDDDIALYEGNRESFLGKLEEKYGVIKEEAEATLRHLEKNSGAKKDRAA